MRLGYGERVRKMALEKNMCPWRELEEEGKLGSIDLDNDSMKD